MSASKKLLAYLLAHPGVDHLRADLSAVAGTNEWTREIRTLREKGWQIATTRNGYRLESIDRLTGITERKVINAKIRYQILHRDLSTCQRCGKTPADKIKLEVDHKLPVAWGGDNSLENLWTLCNICNGGKKHFASDYDSGQMKLVMAEKSGSGRLRKFLELNANIEIAPYRLDIISQVRDWERVIRKIREDYDMDIRWLKKTHQHPKGAYIYIT